MRTRLDLLCIFCRLYLCFAAWYLILWTKTEFSECVEIQKVKKTFIVSPPPTTHALPKRILPFPAPPPKAPITSPMLPPVHAKNNRGMSNATLPPSMYKKTISCNTDVVTTFQIQRQMALTL